MDKIRQDKPRDKKVSAALGLLVSGLWSRRRAAVVDVLVVWGRVAMEKNEKVCVCERDIMCVLERVGKCVKECM